MAEIYLYTLVSVFAISVISLIGVFTLSLRESLVRKYTFILVALAIGALLGDAFIHLIPESFQVLGSMQAALLIIGGILLFFILEKVLHWHHYHGNEEECEEETGRVKEGNIHPVGYMVLASDGMHNFIDGIIIAASYFVSIEVGIATTVAVLLHEIPQEIGDFGVLLHAGFKKMTAILLNFLSALVALVGAVVVLVLHEFAESALPLLIPISAGGFIYIALSDLIPELHKRGGSAGHSTAQFLAILVGVAAMILLVFAEGENHSHGEEAGHTHTAGEVHEEVSHGDAH